MTNHISGLEVMLSKRWYLTGLAYRHQLLTPPCGCLSHFMHEEEQGLQGHMRRQSVCSNGGKGQCRGLIGLWAVDGADFWTGQGINRGALGALMLRDCLLLLDWTETGLLRYYSNLVTVICALRNFDRQLFSSVQ